MLIGADVVDEGCGYEPGSQLSLLLLWRPLQQVDHGQISIEALYGKCSFRSAGLKSTLIGIRSVHNDGDVISILENL